ncbi:MAG: alpha/beta hydrolase [Acidobacteria bacterium]|nr:MAG: alpha/beta hydrolase [Acidobacteriota bacterium]
MESVATPVAHKAIGTELVRDWTPSSEPKATVVVVHGLAEHSGRYERTGSLLSDAGFHVRSFDLIGAGASGGDRWDIDDWNRYHDQIQTHVEWAKEQGRPVVLMGHSMGGNLVLGYAISDRPPPDLLVASAPALGGGAAWQRAIAPVVAKLVPTLSISNGLKGEQLSRDPAVAEAYFADPLVHPKSTTRLGAALFAAMDDVASNCDRLDLPTLVLHGGLDTIVPPQSSAFLESLPGVDRRLYPSLRHEILNEPEGPEVVSDIIDWVDARI